MQRGLRQVPSPSPGRPSAAWRRLPSSQHRDCPDLHLHCPALSRPLSCPGARPSLLVAASGFCWLHADPLVALMTRSRGSCEGLMGAVTAMGKPPETGWQSSESTRIPLGAFINLLIYALDKYLLRVYVRH